jgi:hypothetical protein
MSSIDRRLCAGAALVLKSRAKGILKVMFSKGNTAALWIATVLPAVAQAGATDQSARFTVRCAGNETNTMARLTDPAASAVKTTFSVKLTFQLDTTPQRVYIFQEHRWVNLTEATEYRLAFLWHSNFYNSAAIDRYTDVYRHIEFTDKESAPVKSPMLVSRKGACKAEPYSEPLAK